VLSANRVQAETRNLREVRVDLGDGQPLSIAGAVLDRARYGCFRPGAGWVVLAGLLLRHIISGVIIRRQPVTPSFRSACKDSGNNERRDPTPDADLGRRVLRHRRSLMC